MALNKVYWDYDHAQSNDWATYGVKYANKQIYANPNFSWGNLDYSFPTSFRKRNITQLKFTGNGQSQACETIPDCLIYNSMIAYTGNSTTGSFYKDNYYSYYSVGNEGYFPVIDIDTHDFAYKMTLRIFTSGNWVTVNAVDFVNNYDSYGTNVYGYINNYIESPGSRYTFCNYYVTADSQFSVHANIYGYRTSGYGSVNQGGHAVSGQTAWHNRSIWQLAATTAGNYSNLSYPANSYFPFEIPELSGQSWNAGSQVAPDAIITGGTYTNHAVLVYNDQRVYMPLKHILKDIIVNCGLVLLDSNDVKWISMVDENGLCQDKLVLLSSDEAKESSIYNTRTSDNNLNPSPAPPTPSGDDDYESMKTGFASTLSGCTKYYLMSPLDIVTLIRDYYTRAFAGSTLSNSIISCYLCGLSPAEFISTGTPAPIKIPTVAGEQIFESANSYKAIDAVVNKIQVGNIAVPRMNNDFHDFSPYTIYEVFIPYCGWISLPDTVAGKHIYVEFHVDVRTMAGKAIVLIGADDGGKATCAEMSMNFGASTPFAVIEAGLERQAAVTAGIQTAIGTASAITGITSGHNALTVSSIGTAAQGIANGMMSSMANYTQVQGKAGDTSDFANGRQCYLKISWAKTDEVVNNSRFGHSIGYLCNTVGKIKDFKGLTVCANPHVNGIECTESEKEEIKRLLEEGIIVN